MAANTPMLLRAAMVDGRPDLGLMSAGQVAGLIGDLPSCAELIRQITAEAEQIMTRLPTLLTPAPGPLPAPGPRSGSGPGPTA
jgi:hypothetical protein